MTTFGPLHPNNGEHSPYKHTQLEKLNKGVAQLMKNMGVPLVAQQ